MSLIAKFDPWRSALCTCPPKLTFNPYTGCDHACTYCYASSYVPKFFSCRPKKDLIPRLKREASKLKGEIVSISNSSDPYPNLEVRTGLMRECLEILSRGNCRIQIITKSHLVVRDIDLLKKVSSMVSMTVTTEDANIARMIEPNAPLPSERLKAMRTLIAKGIPASARIDPIIPFVNDNPEKLVKMLASIGVKHVTSSTCKVKPDGWKRISKALPETVEKLRPLYFEEGESASGYAFLPRDLRVRLMKDIGILVKKNGMRFGTCREGLSHFNTGTCDGTWLLGKKKGER